MSDLLRIYETDELRSDGYPRAWPEINAAVVEATGSRCIRCGHPYRKGQHGNGEWSPCDEGCNHEPSSCRDASTHGIAAGLATGRDVGWLIERTGRSIEARWRILTVHHLTGSWGNTHDAKRNCLWWNLLPLCQRCHLQIQGKVNPYVPWPWEHSKWFRPYVAGFYAWRYGGVEFARHDMDAIDHWLKVGMASDAIERLPL